MWPFRKKKRRYIGGGKQPAKVIPAWWTSRVHAYVWLNADDSGFSVFTYSIRVKVEKSQYCPNGYSTVFTATDIVGVALCALKVRRLYRQWKAAKIVR